MDPAFTCLEWVECIGDQTLRAVPLWKTGSNKHVELGGLFIPKVLSTFIYGFVKAESGYRKTASGSYYHGLSKWATGAHSAGACYRTTEKPWTKREVHRGSANGAGAASICHEARAWLLLP